MKLFFIVATLVSFQVMATEAKQLAGRYEGLGIRAERCEVVISEQDQGMQISLIQNSGTTRVSFIGESKSFSDNAEVISNGSSRVVFGFATNGDLQIVMMTGAGQSQECGSLKQF
jgi:hypothetical protein